MKKSCLHLFWLCLSLSPVTDAQDRIFSPGSVLSLGCIACHGQAEQNSLIPSLSLMNSEQIEAALLAFKRNERQGTLMPRITDALSVEQIQVIAEFLGQSDSSK